MLKSLPEFQSLPGAELVRMIESGPVLVTQNEEPRFVAQSVEAFEEMVRRLRELESTGRRRDAIRRAKIIPLRP